MNQVMNSLAVRKKITFKKLNAVFNISSERKKLSHRAQ